jgi:hypothetical protein
MSREDDRHFSTADLARAGEPQPAPDMDASMHSAQGSAPQGEMPHREREAPHAEPLAALFQGPVADDFRRRWDAIQIGFVDDPRAAVRNADELVAQVLRTLAESFAEQRSDIEDGLGGDEQGNTENMRIALQRYRSFFQRLLSL